MSWVKPSKPSHPAAPTLQTSKKDYVHIFLPGGSTGRRLITEREITKAAADLPSGSTLKDVKNFLYAKTQRLAGTEHGTNSLQKDCAPGPSGQRGEHAEQIYKLKQETFKSRWFRALDEFTAWAYPTQRSPPSTFSS
jgi:hypothetical protein